MEEKKTRKAVYNPEADKRWRERIIKLCIARETIKRE